MPAFKYKARDRDGRRSAGIVDGASVEEAAGKLIEKGMFPSEVRLKKTSLVSGFAPGGGKAVPAREKIALVSRLAALLKAGLPISVSLDLLLEQAGEGKLKAVLTDLKNRVRDGETLSGAMARHDSVFTRVSVAMVAAGESSGSLDDRLEDLARSMERDLETEEKAREALRYPKIVMACLTMAFLVLIGFVVPRYASIFERVDMPLPAPTVALVTAGDLVERYWAPAAALAVFCLFSLRWWINTPRGGDWFDGVSIRAPFIGEILRSLCLARWANTLASLLRAGVPIISAIELSAASAGNSRISKDVLSVARRVEDGDGFSEPLSRINIVPDIAARMIAAGEASGSLDEMLSQVGDYLEKEAERKIKRGASYIEPALIISLGAVVLFVALAVFLPMWDMTKLARRG